MNGSLHWQKRLTSADGFNTGSLIIWDITMFTGVSAYLDTQRHAHIKAKGLPTGFIPEMDIYSMHLKVCWIFQFKATLIMASLKKLRTVVNVNGGSHFPSLMHNMDREWLGPAPHGTRAGAGRLAGCRNRCRKFYGMLAEPRSIQFTDNPVLPAFRGMLACLPRLG